MGTTDFSWKRRKLGRQAWADYGRAVLVIVGADGEISDAEIPGTKY